MTQALHIAGLASLLLASAGPASALQVFQAGGNSAASVQATVDAFRQVLGTNNGTGPGGFASGRRKINWDAVSDALSDPNFMPAALPRRPARFHLPRCNSTTRNASRRFG